MTPQNEWDRIKEIDRIRRERRSQARDAVEAERQMNATPETLRHRQICVIDELWARDKLTLEQRQAAQEIARVWLSITAGLFAKVQKYEQQSRSCGYEDWRAGTITAYQDRYVPWRDEAGKTAVRGQGNMTLADLVFLLAVDNYGIRQVSDSLRMDQRTVLALVRESLLRYAEIGGWVDVCGRSKIYA